MVAYVELVAGHLPDFRATRSISLQPEQSADHRGVSTSSASGI